MDSLSVDADCVAVRVGAVAQPDDLPVDADSPLADPLLRLAARGESRLGDDLLNALESHIDKDSRHDPRRGAIRLAPRSRRSRLYGLGETSLGVPLGLGNEIRKRDDTMRRLKTSERNAPTAPA